MSALAALCALACVAPAPQAEPVNLFRTALGSPLLQTNWSGTDLPATSHLPVTGQREVLISRRARVRRGQQLVVQGDVELTNDVVSLRGGQRVHHDVTVGLEAVLARSPTAISGVPLSRTMGTVISWREHHFTFTPSTRPRIPPPRSDDAYINLVASARMRQPPSRCVNPYSEAPTACAVTVERQLNQLGVLVLPSRRAAGGVVVAATLHGTQISAPQSTDADYGVRTVVWNSSPLHVAAGDIVDVTARLNVSARQLMRSVPQPGAEATGCNVMFSGQLYLSRSATSLSGSALPALGGDTGFNLTQATPQGTWSGNGFWRAPTRGYGRRHVVLVVWAARSLACPAGNVEIAATGARLRTQLYRAHQR